MPAFGHTRPAGLAAMLTVVAILTAGCGGADTRSAAPAAPATVQSVDLTADEERANRAELRAAERQERATTAREDRRLAEAGRRAAAASAAQPPTADAVVATVAAAAKARESDSIAKSAARNAVSQIESCFADTQTYASRQTLSRLPPGAVVSAAAERTFTVTAQSASGHTFAITRNDAGLVERTCGGCADGAW